MNHKHSAKHEQHMHLLCGILFLLAAMILLVYCIYCQRHLASERAFKLMQYEDMHDNWTITYSDGRTDTISIPTTQDVISQGQTVVLSNILPENTEYDTFMMWNRGYDVEFYIDGELRKTYDDNDISKFGTDRPYLYIQVPLEESDMGKEIALRISAPVASSGSRIGSMRVGTSISLLVASIQGPQFELIMGCFLIFIGLIVSLASFFLQFTTGHNIPLKHLGSGVVLASTWILLNSTGRQFLFSNISSARNCAFMVVALMPIPFAFFFDDLMEERYHLVYGSIQHFCLCNFALIFILHITGIKGPSEFFALTNVSIFAIMVSVVAFTINDILHGKGQNYRMSFFGAIFFGFCSALQLVIYHFDLSEKRNGIFLSIGLFFMAMFSTLETIRTLRELRISEAHALKQVETLSMEALRTISKTVDAKDPYTSEHSYRVAEYAVVLAQRLGWDADKVEKLKDAAILHDIGKIGIPDSILNKKGKLTDEEFSIIKSHTTTGAEILQNISSLEYAVDVAKHHHEKYDGSGYPSGLAGEDIPEVARLVCIVDAYDAMHSKRVYRDAIGNDLIREEFLRCRGKHFDPIMLDAFVSLLDEDKLKEISGE